MSFKVHTLFISPYYFKIKSINDLEVWLALPRAGNVRDRMHHDLLGRFKNRRFHLPFVDLLEVFNIADLRGLGNSLTMAKTFPAVVSDGLLGVGSKTAKYKVATNQCPRTPFTRVAMHYSYILWVRYRRIIIK